MTLDANTERIIKEANSIGIADEIKIRNLKISSAFRSMRDNGMKYEDALYKCSIQFCLSTERINRIVISSKKNNNGK